MIKIEKTEVFGFKAAIRGMRNPMNSWDKIDSYEETISNEYNSIDKLFIIGPNDLRLMKKLTLSGPSHRKYLRMITVQADVTAPLYWWKDYDTYKISTVANSCSTMHKITSRPLTLDDFSCEHLFNESEMPLDTPIDMVINEHFDSSSKELERTINILNYWIGEYKKYIDKNDKDTAKKIWWQIIQTLPTSFNQKRTIQLSYETCLNILINRSNHKLDEFRDFCKWIRSLPYSEIITCAVDNKENYNDLKNDFMKKTVYNFFKSMDENAKELDYLSNEELELIFKNITGNRFSL